MICKNIQFSGHALQRMFQRSITEADIRTAIQTGTIIKDYLEEKPYPSHLILGFIKEKPIHVVFATDQDENCYIITVYRPTLDIWNSDYKTKK